MKRSKWLKDQIKYYVLYFQCFWYKIRIIICMQLMLRIFCHVRASIIQGLSFPVSFVLLYSFLPHFQFPVSIFLKKPYFSLLILLSPWLPLQAQMPFPSSSNSLSSPSCLSTTLPPLIFPLCCPPSSFIACTAWAPSGELQLEQQGCGFGTLSCLFSTTTLLKVINKRKDFMMHGNTENDRWNLFTLIWLHLSFRTEITQKTEKEATWLWPCFILF